MHKAIVWFSKNPVAANLLMLCILLLGGSSLLLDKIIIEIFPEFETNTVAVSIPYPGATPGQVEKNVTLIAEEFLHQVEGVESMTSISRENGVFIQLDVISGFDMSEVKEEAKNAIESITTFPEEVESSSYEIASRKRQVIDVVIHGNIPNNELLKLAETVESELTALGLGYVNIESERTHEVSIEVAERHLREYDLSFSELSNIIRRSNKDISAGNLTTSSSEILLRTKSSIENVGDFASITIYQDAEGNEITLGDVATISQTTSHNNLIEERFNQQPSVNISVYRVGDESALDISDIVHQYVAEKQQQLPDHVAITYNRDFSEVLNSRIQLLLSNALYGGLLVIIILSLFLRPKVAFWVSLGIPISFMGCIAMMPLLGVSLNMMSMFAFILALGIVVDDAIITGESIYGQILKGVPTERAIVKGTQAVSVPVIFGIFTTVVAFYPLTTVSTGIGNVLFQIPAIVIPVLLFSLIESLLILPSHLRHVTNAPPKINILTKVQQYIALALTFFIACVYQPTLLFCMKYRYGTLIFFVTITALSYAMLTTGWIRFTFLPPVPSETLSVSLTMPAGTTFDTTSNYIYQLESAAQQLQKKYNADENQPAIINIFSTTRTTSGFVRVQLASPDDRLEELTNERLIREWRKSAGAFPGVEQLQFKSQIGRFDTPVSFQLISTDIESMKTVSAQFKDLMTDYPNLNNIRDDFSSGKEELQIKLKPSAHSLGIDLGQLSDQIRSSFYGLEADSITQGRDQQPVILRYPENERNTISALNNIQIRTGDGTLIPFSEIAYLEKSRSPASIVRENRRRTLLIEADADKQKANLPVIRSELEKKLKELLIQYPQVQFRQEGESSVMTKSFSNLGNSFIIALLIMYGLLAVPLKSYFKPLIVMLIIPFAASYAILGHMIMGIGMSMMSFVGIIALSGVALNDALILVVFINRRTAHNVDLHQAVSEAGQQRFRPILLTSLTTFFGLFPLIFETSTQALFLIPTGVSIAWGILFSTAAILILIPIIYLILNDISKFFGFHTKQMPVTETETDTQPTHPAH